jgi:hypothetical protein
MLLFYVPQSYDSDSDSDKGYKNKKVSKKSKKSYVRNTKPQTHMHGSNSSPEVSAIFSYDVLSR